MTDVAPTTLQNVIPSYLFWQYADDDDLQAFVASYNGLAQDYIDTFNGLNLPNYTADSVAGPLLDWVAQGLYGIVRPVLPSGHAVSLGPLNTVQLNYLPLNAQRQIGPTDVYVTSDDIFKRIITWNFYKGDGFVFSVPWLKRRVVQFLNGPQGRPINTADTSQVSVTFGTGNQIDINLRTGTRTVTDGPLNTRPLNTLALNQMDTTFVAGDIIPLATIFNAAISARVLALPFQYAFVVNL